MTTVFRSAPPTAARVRRSIQPIANGSLSITRGASRHRRSLAVLVPLLVLAGVFHGVGMDLAPQRIDDEGTYVAQAYAAEVFHSLGHYTYWYDHPPLGWLQLAGYTWITAAFERHDVAVMAGREAMLVVQLISVVLLWLLARRLGLARWSSALAVALFSLSPLAVQFHRAVYLDNIATPWVLAAFVLALSPQRRLSAYAGAGLCFAVAVLTKETTLLLLPALVWQLWRLGSGTQTRRYGLALAGSLFALAGVFYVAYAIVKGEFMPGAGHVSLLTGVGFQLFSRAPSGSIFTDGTLSRNHLEQWLQLDLLLPALAAICTPIAFLVRRLRPLALALALMLVTMLRPGYLPVPYVIAMIPFAAIVAAGVADAAVRRRRRVYAHARRKPKTTGPAWVRLLRTRPLLPVVALVGVLAVGYAAPAWASQQRGLFEAPLDVPLRQTQAWVEQNVPRNARLMVDDVFWVDLLRAGFPRENVVWYYKVDTDPEVRSLYPGGWREYDYLLSTESVRSTDTSGDVGAALASSAPVAVFGSGPQRVEVRRILPRGLDGLQSARDSLVRLQTSAGVSLVANPNLQATQQLRDQLTGGRVDVRVINALAMLASEQPVLVQALPVDPGEAAAGLPVRAVEISTADAATARAMVEAQDGPYRPLSVQQLPDDVLRVTWPAELVPTLPVV